MTNDRSRNASERARSRFIAVCECTFEHFHRICSRCDLRYVVPKMASANSTATRTIRCWDITCEATVSSPAALDVIDSVHVPTRINHGSQRIYKSRVGFLRIGGVIAGSWWMVIVVGVEPPHLLGRSTTGHDLGIVRIMHYTYEYKILQ